MNTPKYKGLGVFGWPTGVMHGFRWGCMLSDALERRFDSIHKGNQLRSAAISNYFIWAVEYNRSYSYETSGINEYYHSILEMSEKGWPSGLRWLQRRTWMKIRRTEFEL